MMLKQDTLSCIPLVHVFRATPDMVWLVLQPSSGNNQVCMCSYSISIKNCRNNAAEITRKKGRHCTIRHAKLGEKECFPVLLVTPCQHIIGRVRECECYVLLHSILPHAGFVVKHMSSYLQRVVFQRALLMGPRL